MNDNDLRDLFAAFAILKMDWSSAERDAEHADTCYAIADAMLRARRPATTEEIGIVAIKKRRATK